MRMRQLTAIKAFHRCFPMTSAICFLTRQYSSLGNMFMEGKGDLQCSQNITMNPEKQSHEMVLTVQ